MKIKNLLYVICCSLSLIGCVSPKSSTTSIQLPPPPLPMDAILPQQQGRMPASEMPPGTITFEQAVNTPADGLGANSDQLTEQARQFKNDRRKYGMIGAFMRICKNDASHPFCIAYKYKDTPVDRNRERKVKMAAGTIHKHLKKKEYDKLKDVDINNLIGAAKKMKFDNLKTSSDDIASREECYDEDLYIALGSTLELQFPNDEVVALNNRLLEKTQKCSSTDMAAKAVYRLGLFKVWKNQCDSALPIFDLSLSNQSMKPLHARSNYWRTWCKSKANNTQPGNFYKDFPASYDPALADDGPSLMSVSLLSSAKDPVVKFRTSNNANFNALLDTVDAFIKIGENDIAFALLQNLKTDQVQNEEPETLLYFAILCNRVQFGLLKFKVLTKVFDKNPQFKSLNTMKLFYPAWYLDVVTTYKEKINPYLIMALIRQESAFNPKAHSVADARGLMQLLPMTGKQFGRVQRHELFNPKKNIDSGVRFFSYLMNRYNNQVHLALAAYNAGPTTVDNWVKRYPTENSLLFAEMMPYKETREYVGSILRNWYWYSQLYANATFPPQQASNQ